MHKIDHGAPPDCLAIYRCPQHSWEDLMRNRQHHSEIHDALSIIQKNRCAYCESPVDMDAHVDHFRQRSSQPQLTFSWTNLFRSCTHAGKTGCCGKFKDEQADIYNPIDLIDPSVEDPEQFLRFLQDGRVIAKDAIGSGRHRAEETIRVLNLKCVRLQNMRANAIRTYKGILMDIAECPEFIDEELNNIRDEPFATAIKQYLLCL